LRDVPPATDSRVLQFRPALLGVRNSARNSSESDTRINDDLVFTTPALRATATDLLSPFTTSFITSLANGIFCIVRGFLAYASGLTARDALPHLSKLGSCRNPETSLIIAAPAPIAISATAAFRVSIEIGIFSLREALRAPARAAPAPVLPRFPKNRPRRLRSYINNVRALRCICSACSTARSPAKTFRRRRNCRASHQHAHHQRLPPRASSL